MAHATKFLRRHLLHHRRRLLSPLQTFENPNTNLISSSFYSPILTSRSQLFKPSQNPNPNLSSSRSFYWIPWTRSSNNAVGFEDASNGSDNGSEFVPIEESTDLGFGSSGVFEDDKLKSANNGSGLSSVTGSETGLEVANLEDNPWYSPFRESLIWMMDGIHDLTGGWSNFPILIAGLHYVNVQISFRNFKLEALPGIIGLLAKYYKLYLDVLAIPILFIGFFIPQGSLVYCVTNSSLTLIQLLFLKNPYIRNKLGLAPEKVIKKRVSAEPFMLENGDTSQCEIPAETLFPEKLLDISLEYLAAGHQDKALPLLRVATKKDPEMVRTLVAMGQILCSKKSFGEAVDCFERAIAKIQLEEQNSLLVLAFFGAGVSRIWQGRKPEGIQHLKRIAELKMPDDPMDTACYYKGLVMLGSQLFGDGVKTEAAKYLRIAATYDPGVNAYLKECEEGADQSKDQ